MPLPRLQTIGDESVTFLYAINWTQSVRQPDVGRYQRGEGGPFDNRIFLRPGVGEALVRLNHLLRPLIHHQWAVKVATLNRLDESSSSASSSAPSACRSSACAGYTRLRRGVPDPGGGAGG